MTDIIAPTEAQGSGSAVPGELALVVALREGKDGPDLRFEAVTDADLHQARSEIWLHEYLRKGHPAVPLSELSTRVLPIIGKEGTEQCSGFSLTAVDGKGNDATRVFSIYALDPVAQRGREALRASRGEENGTYYFRVLARKRAPAPPAVQPASFTIARNEKPLSYLCRPLAPLLERAKPVGDIDSAAAYPVFYTADALSKAERLARRGERLDPAIETGCLLLGPLCSCPVSGEFFAVVCDALELFDTEQTTYSLSYTSKTWSRIETMITARQRSPEMRAHGILGQAHGHPFLPTHDDQTCSTCGKWETCAMTSTLPSSSDALWCQAVFNGQPWALCHIFGFSAR